MRRNTSNKRPSENMTHSWFVLCSKVVSRFRQEGLRAAIRYYFGKTRHLAHRIVYDHWLDRLECRPSGRAYVVSEDDILGIVPPPGERLYQAFPRLTFLSSIKALGIDPTTYSFVDYGSGRGRLILTAARLPFRRVIGVEFAHSLHQDACKNITYYPKTKLVCGDVVSLNVNAIDFEFPDGNIVAFFFNPFTEDILDRVAQRIEQACQAERRSVYIIFANSNRLPLFANRPAFRPFSVSMMSRVLLAATAPVPIKFFSVRNERLNATDRTQKTKK